MTAKAAIGPKGLRHHGNNVFYLIFLPLFYYFIFFMYVVSCALLKKYIIYKIMVKKLNK